MDSHCLCSQEAQMSTGVQNPLPHSRTLAHSCCHSHSGSSLLLKLSGNTVTVRSRAVTIDSLTSVRLAMKIHHSTPLTSYGKCISNMPKHPWCRVGCESALGNVRSQTSVWMRLWGIGVCIFFLCRWAVIWGVEGDREVTWVLELCQEAIQIFLESRDF